MIEEFGNRQNLGMPEASVLQAIANTLIIEKFQVQWTQKSDDSVAFLVQMTKQLTEIYHVSNQCCYLKGSVKIILRLFILPGKDSNKSRLPG